MDAQLCHAHAYLKCFIRNGHIVMEELVSAIMTPEGEITGVSHQFINETANVDHRQSGDNVFAHHNTVDKALGSMTEVGAHEASRWTEGPALGRREPVLQAKGDSFGEFKDNGTSSTYTKQ
ncbi:MAG: hypothetical protein FRX49_06378 [Trebouxia sp. A1-2]|nr:MAG: hypothetical protein FRX49_06378 [Trebouxia sp. A1-2]